MVFQNYALYPHMTVGDNLGFGLRLRKVPKAAARSSASREVARILGLDELLDRKPGELSGGQRQRVAMGRAMVREPKAFLMDEPLSNLDAKLRVTMRAELARLHERLGVTTVYVTHDQVEAMTLGQRVAVLRDGVLQQVDTPQTLFREPANLFVAAFIGSPSMNLVEADVGGGRLRFAGLRASAPRRTAARRATRDRRHPADRLPWIGRAGGREPAAAARPCARSSRISAPSRTSSSRSTRRASSPTPCAPPRTTADADDEALLADDQRALFTARVDAHRASRRARSSSSRVDPRRLHFFDPGTGAASRPR